MFRCGTAFMTHIEEVVGVAHLDDVGVDDVEPSLWSLCEQCGLAGQRIELVVDVGIVYFVFAVALTGGEVDHKLLLLLVVHSLRSPYAPHFFPVHVVLRGQGGEVDVGTRPVDEVLTFHQHEPLVVAPSVFSSVAFPFRLSDTVAPAKHMEVCHGEIERPVRPAEDMWVADAALSGDSVAGDDRLVVVECRPCVSVPADGHVQAVVLVFVIHHQVGCWLLTRLSRCSCPCRGCSCPCEHQ